MQKKIKWFVIILIVGILWCAGAMASRLASGISVDNTEWTWDDDGTISISGTVVELSDEQRYEFWSSIKTATVEEGVTSISDSMFAQCENLTSVTLPESVTSIGEYAFSWCYKLTGINIPNSVTSIGAHAFNYCTSLTSMTIPASVH